MIKRETLMGVGIGFVLAIVAFFRVLLFHGDTVAAIAVAVSIMVIVITSTIVGTLLPLGLHRFGFDPAHAGPAIQVLMDITGVFLSCFICNFFFRLWGRQESSV